jgi:sulfite reductase alpha subunit-like flavoprotein
MLDYDYTKITAKSLLLIVASTFGNGEPPENGKTFCEMVNQCTKELKENIPEKSSQLKKVRTTPR